MAKQHIDDPEEESWFEEMNERLSPGELRLRRTHRFRGMMRLAVVLVALVALIIPGALFNLSIIGSRTNPLWALFSVIPAILTVTGVFVLMGMFVQSVFNMESLWEGFQYATLCLIGRWPLKYPFVMVSGGKIRPADKKKFLANRELGGPGRLIVATDSAVVLGRYGRITRIIGPGAVFVDRFEHIRETIDLRPQIIKKDMARAVTRDGLAVGTSITVKFQVRCLEPTLEHPYQPDPAALEQIARQQAVGVLGDKVFNRTWLQGVDGSLESTLRGIIATKSLDEVFEPTDATKDPRDEISRDMLANVQTSAANMGVTILDITLGPFRALDPLVERQRRRNWQARQQAAIAEEYAHAEAETMLARETAYAYAQLDMISTIGQRFEQFVEQGEQLPDYFVAQKFVESLRRMAGQSGVGPLMPMESIRTLEFLNTRLLGHDASSSDPSGSGSTGTVSSSGTSSDGTATP